jgi:sarcosine oxidase, subunit gamma
MAERRSPLHDRARDLAAACEEAPDRIRIAEVPFLAQLTLRLDPASAAAAGAAAGALGAPLPVEPGTSARAGDADVLWMGPDEWLVLAPDGRGDALAAALADALAGRHATVVDVSAQRTAIEVAGSAARDVLARGCSLDLHPRAFSPGRCAQTLLARAGVVLLQRGEEPAYLVLVRASFAEYLAAWLLDACVEERGGGMPEAPAARAPAAARRA